MERQIYEELKVGVLNWRHTRYMRTQWNTRLDPVLRNGLITYEYEAFTGIRNPLGINAWKADVTRGVNASMRFVGITIQFCYTDAHRIRHYVMDHFDLHKHPSRHAEYSFGAYVCAHYGSVCSVWVYVALMTPVREDANDKDKGGDGQPALNTGIPLIKRIW